MLHLKAAGGATAVLGVVMLIGSWAVVATEHDALRANLRTHALHERFDRLERMVAGSSESE